MTMDGDDMRRGNNFFRRNQYKIAAVCLIAAVLGIAGAYMFAGSGSSSVPKQQTAMEDTEKTEKTKKTTVAKEEKKEEKKDEKKDKTEKTEKTAKASTVIKPNQYIKNDTETKTVQPAPEKTETAKAESEEELEKEEIAKEDVQEEEPETVETAASAELHFDTDAGLLWPIDGAVILNFCMDKTVYFTTLDQYKYNPAVIIAGNVNDKVKAAANGRITDISTNEETGCTVTMDLGDGYTAVYGQLKEVPYEAGAYLEAGTTIGFVSEPTKYYSLEGSNVYFELDKDGVPVDPVKLFK